jgi:glycyl-tRNA synthetase beta chain
MPQLLLELFSEEIPARMQAGAARDLERMASERLKAAGLTWDALTTWAGPRRLTLVIEGLPAATPDRAEELKGPRANAPEQALEGFLRKTGLTRDQLTERDGVLFAVIDQKGVQTTAVVAEAVDQIVRTFPWPKSMRWGSGTLRWVRPLKRIVALFDGAVVPFEIDGIHSGDVTEGHRFMGAAKPFAVRDFADYRARLEQHFVLLDAADRGRQRDAWQLWNRVLVGIGLLAFAATLFIVLANRCAAADESNADGGRAQRHRFTAG